MNVKCFVLLEILVRLCCVVSYTVVLKQVKPLYQPVKVYRYDLRHPKIISDGNGPFLYKPTLSQKIYPVKGKNFRPRGVGKKDSKYVKSLWAENPLQKEGRLYGISQQLVPPLSNQIEEYSDAKAGAEEAPKEDVDGHILSAASPHEKSFASFGQEKGKIYKTPGEWATPAPNDESENETRSAFTPSQLYLQIRHKNTVIHVPQSEALKDAETLEELINAPRLKELARTTHVQETYSEEGYEDAAYDHAGQIRQAQHGEIYDAKDEGRFKIKEAPVILDYDSNLEESKKASLKDTESQFNQQEDINNKLEPRITRQRNELRKAGIEYNKEPPESYKGEHIFSSRVKILKPKANNGSVGPATFPSFFDEMPPHPDNVFKRDSALTYMTPPMKISSKYRKEDLNSTKIYPVVGPPTEKPGGEFTDFKPHISETDSQASPSAKSLKYSRIYSKKTKQLRLEPYKTGNVHTPPPPSEHLQPPVEETPEEPISQRIVLPTIGYINSLTTAHFGKEVSATAQEEPKSELTSALNLTQALSYLRSNKDQKNIGQPNFFNETEIKTFEPMRLKKQRPSYRNFANKTKRDVYLMREQDSVSEQSEYEGYDEEDLPHKKKNSEIRDDERKRIEEENREKEKFEIELREEIMAKEKEIIKEAFKNIGDDPPESFLEDSSSESDFHYVQSTTFSPIDFKKYPFYSSKRLPENSPLRYASDPLTFPRKSGHAMEFYESREQLIQCPDFHPHLGDLPNSNSTDNSEELPGENQRLTSLGDKITCLRSKYFDPEPFDNPIFKEREIDYVGKPKKGFKKLISSQSKTTTKTSKPLLFYKKSTTPTSNNEKSKMLLTTTEFSRKSPQVSGSLESQHRLNQHLVPIKILPFVSTPTTGSLFIEPVTEIAKGFSSFASKPAVEEKAGTGWKAFFQPKSGSPELSKIVPRKNCTHVITKIAALDGASNLTIQCNNATLIQEIINGVAYTRTIPKERWSAKMFSKSRSNESDWVPIIGYDITNFTKPLNRKTDDIINPKNETTEKPSSDQYVIDELKEDKNIRQGEVVEDIDHYLKMTDSAEMTTERKKEVEKRKRREAIDLKHKIGNHVAQRPSGSIVFDAIEKVTQIQIPVTNKTDATTKATFSKMFKAKRTLGRLSGRDFLTRYHKNKSKPKTADFWKIASTSKNVQKHQKFDPANASQKIFRENLTSDAVFKTNISDEKPMSAEEDRKNSSSTDLQARSPASFITEKITKKSESKIPKIVLQMGKPSDNVTKIVMKVSKEVSESSEKPRMIQKKYESTISKENFSKGSKNPEVHYKTINRNKNYSKKSEQEDSNSDGPILYYVMDVKTGMGKWITHYEEQKRSGKFRKTGKIKENFQTRRDKKRKKTKY